MRICLLLVVALTSACRTVPGSQKDVESLLAVALPMIERNSGKPVIVVAGEKLDPGVLAAVKRTRKVVRADEAETPEASLAANHLRIDKIEIDGNTARFQAWLGPIRKAKPGEILLDCGTGHHIVFERIAEAPYWKATNVGMSVC